jgi:RHS repeat-associated protein
MRNNRVRLTRLLCCLLSYTMLAATASGGAPSVMSTSITSKTTRNAPAKASRAAQSDAPRHEDELLVRFRADISEQSKRGAASSKGGHLKGALRGGSGVNRVEVQSGQDATSVAARLRTLPEVEAVEPNFLVSNSQATPDDSRFGEQWALRNTGQAGRTAGSDVNAAPAWRESTGSTSTVIAVLDSGIDFSHPDLTDNLWVNPGETSGNGIDDDGDGLVDDSRGWNFVYDTNDASDDQGHGTSVAGIIAAEGNNHAGVSGVMWRASLMSLKVLDSTGTGDVASAVEAIDYAVAHGAQVINCSWGTDADSTFLKDAIERAGRKGVVVVASAGNNARNIDTTPYYPASYDLTNLISVAATDGFDNLASFSDWGAQRVAVAAPGLDVLTTQQGGDYRVVSGTSAAAPFVSGVAGLIKTLRPNAPASQVCAAIVGGVRRVAALSGKVSSGGVADAAGALASLHGNPYNNGNGGGNGNGNGNGNGQRYVPPALRHDNDRSKGRDRGGIVVEPSAALKGSPGGLPNLDESRKVRTSPEPPAHSASIHADLACADCDTSGGGGAGGGDPYFGTGRTRPPNSTGRPGVTLGSRNFNWGLPLVSLPGRAGLDLNISLFYNSLVWTKQGNIIQFNPDHGTPSPGFQLGLPRLQQKFIDADALPVNNVNAYVMITPSGGRVEMKQVGSSTVYESADSTYTQLTEGSSPVVRTTDGTQYVFGQAVSGEWRCTQVKDRNGNYITAQYNPANGHTTSITDTLGRTVNFNYNGTTNLLETITQTWNGTTHTYATFNYGTAPLSYTFTTDLGLVPPAGGANQTVLASVVLSGNLDSYTFDYNSYGQVYRIKHYAPDGHELARTTYTFNTSGAQTDCPRFTEQREWAQRWNNDIDDLFASAEEAVTTYAVTDNVQFQHPWNNVWMTGTLSQQTLPDGTIYKEYALNSGWPAGLPQLSEYWSGGVRKKYSYNTWTQDNTSVSYQVNPRIIETNVKDLEGNRRRVTIDYNVGYGLPTKVREWGGPNYDQLQRWTDITYKNDTAYINNRIIGLPYERVVFDGNGNVKSRLIYQYDWSGNDPWGDPYISNQTPSTNYADPGYVTGRGNLIGLVRYNCTNNTTAYDDAQALWVQLAGYNKAGSVVWTKDNLGHKMSASYADSFSDASKNSLNTLAYPTQVTDEENNSATTQYNYDFGALTRTHSPTAGIGAGITYVDIVLQYDSYGRAQQATNQTNNAYKRWVYDTNYTNVHTYETIISTAQADEFHSWRVIDGVGRVRASASDHPNGTGGFAGQYVLYDNMGRVWQQSNPADINGGWVPQGDDSAGWITLTQTYDWKGRPRQATNQDGTTRVIDYTGCGCAGGEVTTTQDEHGRKRRYSEDMMGRMVKVEEFDWFGSVYSTTNYTYDALDRLIQTSQAGQTRTFDYDGHGRLWHRTTPEQGTATFAYYNDDAVASMTDARGAKANIAYNARHLPTTISYDLSNVIAGQNVAATPTVTYAYDAAGNRTSMTEKDSNNALLGSSAYHYDNLSRMDWEQRTFTTSPGVTLATYTINYGYNVGGELQSITYPWSAQVTYAYDKAGRLNSIGGSGYVGVTSYASGVTYRAFGGIKGMTFNEGAGRTLSTSYDNRLRPTKWDVSGVLGYKYYYNDFNEKTGRVTYAQSITGQNPALDRSQTSSPEDRSYEYDHVGRLVYAHSGAESKAHAIGGPWGIMDGPYSQGYEYDSFGNMTHRYGWGGEVQGGSPGVSTDFTYTYTNNRRNGFSYDNAGNLTFDGGQHFTYDAMGQQVSSDYTDLHQYYDGDGLRIKKTENGSSLIRYYLRSTVLGGQVLGECNNSLGGWQRGYVYAGGAPIAIQQNGVFFVHEDPVTKSKRVTAATDGSVQSTVELDPWGADTSHSSNSTFQPHKFTTYERDSNGSDEAMFRRYNRWHSRLDQPDPYGGSYNLSDPQSLNRYAYVKNDPVNFTDPTGLTWNLWDASVGWGAAGQGFWGSGWNFNDRGSAGRRIVYEAQIRYDVGIDIARFFHILPPGARYVGNGDWVVSNPVDLGVDENGDERWGGGESFRYKFTPRLGFDNYMINGLNPDYHPLPWRGPNVPNPSPQTPGPPEPVEPVEPAPGLRHGPEGGHELDPDYVPNGRAARTSKGLMKLLEGLLNFKVPGGPAPVMPIMINIPCMDDIMRGQPCREHVPST